MDMEDARCAGRDKHAQKTTAGAPQRQPAASQKVDTQHISTCGCWGAAVRLRESQP
jgi:hypothetical protein